MKDVFHTYFKMTGQDHCKYDWNQFVTYYEEHHIILPSLIKVIFMHCRNMETPMSRQTISNSLKNNRRTRHCRRLCMLIILIIIRRIVFLNSMWWFKMGQIRVSHKKRNLQVTSNFYGYLNFVRLYLGFQRSRSY